MRVKEAAAMLEVSPHTVYGLVSAGKLRHYRIGVGRGSIRIAEDHVREFLAGVEQGGAKPAARPAAVAPPYVLQHLRPRKA